MTAQRNKISTPVQLDSRASNSFLFLSGLGSILFFQFYSPILTARTGRLRKNLSFVSTKIVLSLHHEY